MYAVKVQYTVQESYAATNQANIKKVLSDLAQVDTSDFKYTVFMLDDGKSFVHFLMAKYEGANKGLTELPAFQEFQRQLRESKPEVPPQVENLSLVGSSQEVF